MRIQIQDFSFEGTIEEARFLLKEVLENHINCIRISFLNSKSSLDEFIEAEKTSKLFRELITPQESLESNVEESDNLDESSNKQGRAGSYIKKTKLDGTFVKVYKSVREAAYNELVAGNSIYRAISRNVPLKGYRYMYISKEEYDAHLNGFKDIDDCLEFIKKEDKKPYKTTPKA